MYFCAKIKRICLVISVKFGEAQRHPLFCHKTASALLDFDYLF